MYILFAILIFSFLILIHELGHFMTAKASGVQVNEFSIFMGPTLLKKKIGETTYSLRCIPIGGFCAMEGEDEDSENPRAFTSVAVWKRLVILAAGSFMNFLAGFLLVLILFLSTGSDQYITPVIDAFYDGCPLQSEQGLQVGDEILSIDGEPVYIYSDVAMLLSRNETGKFDLVIKRDGHKLELNQFPMEMRNYIIDGETVRRYGIQYRLAEKSAGAALRYTWNNSIDFARLVRLGLQDLVTGSVGLKDMSGPVGIVSVISETGHEAKTTADGVWNVLYLAAFIAINLAVMNLLPLPALDGGRILCLLLTVLIEAITKKKLDPKYEGYVHTAGMVVLMGFMVYITFQDVIHLIAGG